MKKNTTLWYTAHVGDSTLYIISDEIVNKTLFIMLFLHVSDFYKLVRIIQL